ncbi:MAG: hypothetical protein ACOC1L_08065 [Bacillota bacterium]
MKPVAALKKKSQNVINKVKAFSFKRFIKQFHPRYLPQKQY